jgi:hypothetical protein
MADLKAHLQTNLVQAEALGQTERAKRLKARLVELNGPSDSSKMTKAELLAAAEAAGVEVDESMTKKEIVAVLEEGD